ncbi:MAG: DUF2442 domain-containing protein [Candidatus Omnitrophica bacterium]|nr:DUF2442 domain-containing protein [Candidatus Omnitrophota bacterium]
MTYPKIKSVKILDNNCLEVIFEENTKKIYDCTPLLKEEPFTALKDRALFKNAHIECGGYAIAWNDYIDLSESEIWINGR